MVCCVPSVVSHTQGSRAFTLAVFVLKRVVVLVMAMVMVSCASDWQQCIGALEVEQIVW